MGAAGCSVKTAEKQPVVEGVAEDVGWLRIHLAKEERIQSGSGSLVGALAFGRKTGMEDRVDEEVVTGLRKRRCSPQWREGQEKRRLVQIM